MKSQPDAASRMVAEVVTQLPVPSRLGMLRFERLNEASWALLFLDPNCERQFGIPAAELCALIGSPYASLMEPEVRYQLHDCIQQQLATKSHYLVRYTLHTAEGPCIYWSWASPISSITANCFAATCWPLQTSARR